MIGAAVGMFLAVALLATHLPARWLRRVVGYGLSVDVAVLVLCLGVFGGTGLERLAALGASIGVTAALHGYKTLFGYERLGVYAGKRQWLVYDGWLRRF